MTRDKNITRGSILLMSLVLITLTAVVAYLVLDTAMASFKLSQRNEYYARAKSLADSELEIVYFKIKVAMSGGTAATAVPAALSDFCDVVDSAGIPTTDRLPFCAAQQAISPSSPASITWTVRRSIAVDFNAVGTYQGKTANYTYFTVKVEVKAETPTGGLDVRVGRRMNSANSSVFQYNIFAQGDLEFAPGGAVTINGDIAANGAIYMGAQDNAQSTMAVNSYVRYLTGKAFHTAPETTTLPDGTTHIKAPVFGTSQTDQVKELDKPENLLGGISATDVAEQYGVQYLGDGTTANPDHNGLFGQIGWDAVNLKPIAADLSAAENRVYRAVTVPPPDVVADAANYHGGNYTTEYPGVTDAATLATLADDPALAAIRAYNRAGLILTVNPDGTTKYTQVTTSGGVRTETDVTSTYSAITGLLSTTTMYDLREKKDIAIDEIDVSKLKTKLEADYSTFNGLLYVYLSGSTPTNPAAVRLVNGSATPFKNNHTSFSVATNAGLYVKGNYNTVPATHADGSPILDSDGNPIHNPAMLMADAITILSDAWNDSLVTAQVGDPASVIAAKHDPAATFNTRIATSGTTQIVSGLLTGAITHDSAGGYIYSGGGHNLIRFLENWHDSSVDFFGSIGRLFESAQFTSPFKSPNDAYYPMVYNVPGARTFSFDNYLKTNAPYGSAATTAYDRGTIFTW